METSQKCEVCEKEYAKIKCKNCPKILYYCQECFSYAHQLETKKCHIREMIWKTSKNPVVNTDKEVHVETKVMCKIHLERKLEYFCQTCSVIICSDCHISKVHNKHDVIALGDKIAEIAKILDESYSKCEKEITHFEVIKKSSCQQLDKIKMELKKLGTYIDNIFNQINTMINNQKLSLKGKIEKLKEPNYILLELLTVKMDSFITNLKENVKNINKFKANPIQEISSWKTLISNSESINNNIQNGLNYSKEISFLVNKAIISPIVSLNQLEKEILKLSFIHENTNSNVNQNENAIELFQVSERFYNLNDNIFSASSPTQEIKSYSMFQKEFVSPNQRRKSYENHGSQHQTIKSGSSEINKKNSITENLPPEMRKGLLYFLKLSIKIDRFEDMSNFAHELFKFNIALSEEERDLLNIAFKTSFDVKINSLKSLVSYQLRASSQKKSELNEFIQQYRIDIEENIRDSVKNILKSLENFISKIVIKGEESLFYNKLKGDLYRYLAETHSSQAKVDLANKANEAYKQAFSSAESLSFTDIKNLELILSYSEFVHDILNNTPEAIKISQTAIQKSNQIIQGMGSEKSKEIIDFVQVFIENIQKWETIPKVESRVSQIKLNNE